MARTRNQGSNWIRKDKRLAIYLRDDCACAYCGRSPEMGAVLTLDHVIACELGGGNGEDNLITACRSCNSSKQDLTTRAWNVVLRDRGFDSDAIARRTRRQVKRDLRPFRRTAKAMLESLDTNDFDTIGQLAVAAG